MKRGIECEGEFQGLDTLFLDADELPDLLKCKVLPKCEQIYICDHKNELDLYDPDLAFIALVDKRRVTIERTKFDSAPFCVNIMLVVDSDSFWNLRGQDQVKFSKYLNVYSCKKKSMFYTAPVEFTSDVKINVKDYYD